MHGEAFDVSSQFFSVASVVKCKSQMLGLTLSNRTRVTQHMFERCIIPTLSLLTFWLFVEGLCLRYVVSERKIGKVLTIQAALEKRNQSMRILRRA
jgi:hypothetical protein